MPFGTKGSARRRIHFDDVYGEVIKPAVEGAGMQCVRADEEQAGGIIHRPMFERLLLCEFAVADLSLANANVFYELGIRHAVRPWSTVLVFQKDSRLPFDVGPLRGLPYRLGPDGKPARDHAAADRAALTERLGHARRRLPTDSPLYDLTALVPPDTTALGDTEVFRDRVEAIAAVKGRLAAAQEQDDRPGIRAIQEELGDLPSIDPGLAVDLLRAYLAVEAYADVVALVAAMPVVVKSTPYVREQQAFALNRLGRRGEAEAVLERLIDERGASSETYGILGRIHKDQWQDAVDQGRDDMAGVLLHKAIATYLAGFAADWRDHYPGINAVQLIHLSDSADPRIAELLPVVRYAARQKALRHQADYWDHATLLELAVLDEDADAAWVALTHAVYARPLPWQARSTFETLGRLRRARERTRPTPEWMHKIEAALADVTEGEKT
jgi:hypothetical protein